MDFIYFLIVGGLAGWLAGLDWRGTGFGLLGNILIGIVGGMIGGFLQKKKWLPVIFQIIDNQLF